MSRPFWLLFVTFFAIGLHRANATQYNLIHAFAGAPNDGANPQDGASLAVSGSTFYGQTAFGGSNNYGAVFAIGTNGTGLTILHSFNSYDGATPYGAPLLVGNTLYGTTSLGGSNNVFGTVYSVNTDGSNFQLLHSFNSINDGYGPDCTLALSGSTLYGTTTSGGITGANGTVFSINTDGSGYQVLYSFASDSNPSGSVLVSGSTLYGMLHAQLGAVYEMDTTGSNYQVLHYFSGTTNDGAGPYGSLILSGSVLYGMTSAGGANNEGAVFAMNTDGTGFQVLHSFAPNEANQPRGDLTLSGTTLYGMTLRSGPAANGPGAVFQINTDGTGYAILHTFTGTPPDGSAPLGSLVVLNSKLYGMTYGGGTSNSYGCIFSITPGAGNLTGALKVTLSPAAAVAAGALWQVDGGSFHSNNVILTGLAPGSHGISFKAAKGWSPPAAQVITIDSGITNLASATYTDPSVTITTPTNNMTVFTQNYTVAGTTKDDVVVTNVVYSLNGSDWVQASQVNNWAIWNANVALIPGTNVFQSYATDANGNTSPTKTVTFVYIVQAPLSLTLYGGKGTTSIANGALLDVGRSYSITATAAAGFKFTGWTGSTNATNATVKFLMTSNLAFTADFLDVTLPTLSISTPTNGMTVTNANFNMIGTARDNVGVTSVFYELDGGVPQIPATLNNWTNWNVVLALTPGTNTISAWSSDAAGNNSIIHKLSIFYQVKAPLSVTKVGPGTLSTNYNNVMLAIGRNYSITATAASGFKFAGWSGSTNTTNATLRFMMQSNLAFTANFQDATPPTVSITSPTNNQTVTNFSVNVTGKASDNLAVTNVYFSTNDGVVWTSANTTNNWTNWNAIAPLSLGSNVIQAYSEDSTGLASATKSVTVIRQPVRTAFAISQGPNISSPQGQIAFDGANYLVAYQTHPNGLTNGSDDVAQFISPSGQLGGFVDTQMSGDAPCLAFDGSNYLMASLAFTQSGSSVQGAFIGPNGSVGTRAQLSQSTTVDNFGTMVYGGGVYFLAWDDSVNSSNNGGHDSIYGAMVNKDSSIAASDFEIAATGTQVEAGQGSAAFDGSNFLATWGSASGSASVNGRIISPSGVFMTDPFTIYTNHAVAAGTTIDAVAFDGTKYLVLFNAGLGSIAGTNTHILGRFVTTGGVVLTNQITITGDVGPQIVPCVTFDGEHYLVTWNQGFNPFAAAGATAGNTKARFFDVNGHPIAPEITLLSPSSGQTALWATPFFDGTQFFCVIGLGHETSAAPKLKFSNGVLTGAFISE